MRTPTTPSAHQSPPEPQWQTSLSARVAAADLAVHLFAEKGFDATSATDIALAAGISRSTFFRHFRSKDDVIFADHEDALELVAQFFTHHHTDPYWAVCEATLMLFQRSLDRLPILQQRDRVIHQTPVLHDRELVMISRYEKLFRTYLRGRFPDSNPLPAVRFIAAVIATHNYCLRLLLRSAEAPSYQDLSTELSVVHQLMAPGPPDIGQHRAPSERATDDVVIVVVSPSATPDQIATAVQRHLSGGFSSAGSVRC